MECADMDVSTENSDDDLGTVRNGVALELGVVSDMLLERFSCPIRQCTRQ